MTDPREWIAQAKARCDAATPAPWRDGSAPDDKVLPHPRMSVIADGRYVVRNVLADDAEHIAHARTDLPRALAALEAVLDECDACGPTSRPRPYSLIRAIAAALDGAS